jgi:hypothetical protein
MKKDWYIVEDLTSFINSTRALVFNSLGSANIDYADSALDFIHEEDREEFDRSLSYQESFLIAKEILKRQINKKTSEERYLISESLYVKLIDALNHRLVGNLLHGLVNKGLVETSFDEDSNDFVFWVKDDKNKTEEKPETD